VSERGPTEPHQPRQLIYYATYSMYRRREGERGAIAVLAAILLVTVGAFLALSLNVGHKMNAKAQLQAAIDAAALASSRNLNGMGAGMTNVVTTARAYAGAHNIDTDPVTINASSDIVLGFWDKFGKHFYVDGDSFTLGDAVVQLDPLQTPMFYNAVKIVGGADGTTGHNNPLDVFFGAFVGASGGLNVKAGALGLGGGPCDEFANVVPVVVPSCALADGSGNVMCGQQITLSFFAGSGRDIAFADIIQNPTTAGEIQIQTEINSAQAGHASPTFAFQDVPTTAGGLFSAGTISALNTLVCTNGDPTTCGPYVFPVINVGTNCSTPIPGSATPIGFVQVAVRGVTWNVTTHNITVYVFCSIPTVWRSWSSQQGGCADFGFLPRRGTRLAQ
jgi:hypothetical protein